MTEIEAHEFIERWNRKIFSWRAKNEVAAALRIQKFAMGCVFAMFLWMFTAIRQMRHADFYFGIALGILAFMAFCFSFWLASKIHQARRVFGYSQIINRKS
ncbi:MAG TPA: hypothetical protein VIK35_08105 [Verrucomicrobiae bacterium]